MDTGPLVWVYRGERTVLPDEIKGFFKSAGSRRFTVADSVAPLALADWVEENRERFSSPESADALITLLKRYFA